MPKRVLIEVGLSKVKDFFLSRRITQHNEVEVIMSPYIFCIVNDDISKQIAGITLRIKGLDKNLKIYQSSIWKVCKVLQDRYKGGSMVLKDQDKVHPCYSILTGESTHDYFI